MYHASGNLTTRAEYAIALARRFVMLHLEIDVVLAGRFFKGQELFPSDTIIYRGPLLPNALLAFPFSLFLSQAA